MKLRNLTLKDKALFLSYLDLQSHELSPYAFQNIYIWKGLFDIEWFVIEESLCIFFKDKIGCFLYLSPLGRNKSPEVIKKAFQVLDRFNKNKEISRIENIEARDIQFYQQLGYDCVVKSCDYLCLRSDLEKLEGDKFKSKRACFNYFSKHYEFGYLPFSLKYKDDCLELYDCWMRQRKAKTGDRVYLGMMEDSRQCLRKALDNYPDLDLAGRVVKVNKEIKAFTFGFKLNPDTFCILYEITDLSIKGLAQFIFRSFAGELKEYKYINIMDDSGLENLKKVKLSYHPTKLIPAYIAQRKDGSTPR
ncbi:MAG: phosphatidylglycerol lysyltransferase domain-containing protein [Candidatus Omnitrophica bacterium]|nr:phosphatidylglycerol lysyltransferase domain-containing protein [Candidatus Omnitrophota bacterium]